MPADNKNAKSDSAVAGRFDTTHWSLVLAAGQRGTRESAAALERLCQSYWLPLYAYVRRRVSDVHDAQDLTQAFFERLLEKNYLADADPRRGQFRVFLLTAFKHFLSKEWEKAKAQKRGGGRSPISLDFSTGDSQIRLEPAGGLTAEQMYERQWVITLLSCVMQRLERELEKVGKRSQFERLKDFIVSTKEDTTYADVASELGMTESAARMATSRLRRRYRQLLREEIAQTVSSPEDIDDEINSLFTTFVE
jgi:RNA polymerase sigma-70 factor (ECF subfamily)